MVNESPYSQAEHPETFRVLLIESSQTEASSLTGSLQEARIASFEVEHFEALDDGLGRLRETPFDVILLDLNLPDLLGPETFPKITSQSPRTPIVVLSGFDNEELAIEAVRQGAQDYLLKDRLDANILARSLRYAIERKQSEEALRRAYDQLEQRVRERTAELAETNQALMAEISERERAHEMLQKTLEGTINAMAKLVEIRDPYTAGHQHRVSLLATAMAEEMLLARDSIRCIRLAGLIHDIGKIYIPIEVLSKPGLASEIEFNMIRYHIQAGYDILKKIELPELILNIILQHHERLDGSGYPTGLKGNEILQESKIMAVADVVEAMAAHRPHRPSHGLENALQEIEHNAGTLYDPEAVSTCLKLFRENRFSFE